VPPFACCVVCQAYLAKDLGQAPAKDLLKLLLYISSTGADCGSLLLEVCGGMVKGRQSDVHRVVGPGGDRDCGLCCYRGMV
jgi:hypothetical protein